MGWLVHQTRILLDEATSIVEWLPSDWPVEHFPVMVDIGWVQPTAESATSGKMVLDDTSKHLFLMVSASVPGSRFLP